MRAAIYHQIECSAYRAMQMLALIVACLISLYALSSIINLALVLGNAFNLIYNQDQDTLAELNDGRVLARALCESL